MNLINKIPKPVTRFFGRMLLKTKHVSPELCILAGLGCSGAALVMVGVKTWKNKDILEEDAKRVASITKRLDKVDETKEAELTEKQKKQIITNDDGVKFIYTKVARSEMSDEQKKALLARRIDFAKDICKTYWMPFVLGTGSVLLIWGGRTKLRHDLTAMTALYTTAVESYRKLYNKIKEEYGEEKAQELAYGVKMEERIDAETGEIEKHPVVKKGGNTSIYAFMFDAGEFDEDSGEWIWKNHEWSEDKTANFLMVRAAEDNATREVISRGWYALGELKKELGAKPGPGDWRVGWWYKPGQDNKVELRVFDDRYQLPFNKGFADPDNRQKVCLIDPNVDGCIDFIFNDIEKYDFRCGRRAKKRRHMPTNEEMFGADYARKLEGHI